MSEALDDKHYVRDPVCNKVVDPLRARAVGIYGGVTQYFCSPECKASFGDPRTGPTVPNAGPGGRERRYTDQPLKDVAGEETGQWFAKPKEPGERGEPASIDRFDDLEASKPIPVVAPSPSILVDVRAVSPRRTLLLVTVLAAIAILVGIIVLATRAG